MHGADRDILAQHHQETLDLTPLAKPNRIAELAIMAAACRRLVDGKHAELGKKVLGLSNAGAAGDIE